MQGSPPRGHCMLRLIPAIMHQIVLRTSFTATLQTIRTHSLKCKERGPCDQMLALHAAPIPSMGSERPAHARPGHTAISGNAVIREDSTSRRRNVVEAGRLSQRPNPVEPPSAPALVCFVRPRRQIQHVPSLRHYVHYIFRLHRILVLELPGR
jgi:hypothetical protein